MRNARLIDRQLREVSIPFLGTNNQVATLAGLLRQKPSAKSDFCLVRLGEFGRNEGPKTPQKPLAYLFYVPHETKCKRKLTVTRSRNGM